MMDFVVRDRTTRLRDLLLKQSTIKYICSTCSESTCLEAEWYGFIDLLPSSFFVLNMKT
jgi:hypothetical protein